MTREDRDTVRKLVDQLTDIREQLEILAHKYRREPGTYDLEDLLPDEGDLLAGAADRILESEQAITGL